MKVVVAALLLKIAQYRFRILIGTVRKHHDVLAIELNRFLSARLDNQWSVVSGLFLKAAVAVIPVRPVLSHWNPVNEGLARIDPRKAEFGHAIHVRWRSNAVPMY